VKSFLFKADILEAKWRRLETDQEAQTRRLDGLKEINKEPGKWIFVYYMDGHYGFAKTFEDGAIVSKLVKPRYQIGDICYLPETWAVHIKYDSSIPSEVYKSVHIWYHPFDFPEIGCWRSPRFMPAWAARRFVVVTGVKYQHLQDITEEEARAESLQDWYPDIRKSNHAPYHTNLERFMDAWGFCYPRTPWALNPWVAAYTLKKAERP